MEERKAIERLRRGDIGGLEFLVCQHQVRAVRAAYLVTRELSLAQDVVQDAFLKAYDRIEQFDARRPFGPWFLRIVLNDAIKATRKHGRYRSLEEVVDGDAGSSMDLLTDERPGPEALWEQAETTEEVRAALDRLTPEQRAAVVARYYLCMSEAEMTRTLAWPLSTVKWRLHAARQRLLCLLRPMATETPDDGRA